MNYMYMLPYISLDLDFQFYITFYFPLFCR